MPWSRARSFCFIEEDGEQSLMLWIMRLICFLELYLRTKESFSWADWGVRLTSLFSSWAQLSLSLSSRALWFWEEACLGPRSGPGRAGVERLPFEPGLGREDHELAGSGPARSRKVGRAVPYSRQRLVFLSNVFCSGNRTSSSTNTLCFGAFPHSVNITVTRKEVFFSTFCHLIGLPRLNLRILFYLLVHFSFFAFFNCTSLHHELCAT